MPNTKPLTEAELARFYEKHKDDLSLWVKQPRRIRYRRGEGPSTVFSLRLTGDELTRIAQAAHAREMSVSDFIRKATMAAIDEEPSREGQEPLKA
jgi:hypothetical protein